MERTQQTVLAEMLKEALDEWHRRAFERHKHGHTGWLSLETLWDKGQLTRYEIVEKTRVEC